MKNTRFAVAKALELLRGTFDKASFSNGSKQLLMSHQKTLVIHLIFTFIFLLLSSATTP